MQLASKGIMVATVIMLTAFNTLPAAVQPLQVKNSSVSEPAVPVKITGFTSLESAALATPDCPDPSYSLEALFSLGLDGPSPLINDALPNPIYSAPEGAASQTAQALGTGSMAPGPHDTSVFMAGTVAVGIVLPESSGSGENWTQAETDCVVSKIKTGMNWWKAHASAAAKLNFVYDLQIGIPISYEPIQMVNTLSSTWVRATMGSMGYTDSNTQERVYSYNNHIRDVNNTDWAFTIFVVDSSADIDGKFADGSYFAWAYLGGPYLILTYDNDGWGIRNMNWVAAHETGHIFLAGDQYYQAGYGGCNSTTERYGYLGVVNSNCQYNNPTSVPSIMRTNEDALESTASGQVGWKDSNANGIPDTVDTNPAFNLTAFTPDPTTQSKLTYSGKVYDIPRAHAVCTGTGDFCYSKDVTINTISSVTYRVDGGAWNSVPATDAAYDSDYETFSFTTPNLANGLRTLDVKATNSAGNTVTWTDTVTINSSYTITVDLAGNGTGHVTSNPAGIDCGSTCSANFDISSLVTLTAQADPGSIFTGWSGSGCSGTSTCQVTMNGAKDVTATFVLFTYPLDVTLAGYGSGTVTSNPIGIDCGSTCSYGFLPGTLVTLTATPASSKDRFTGWSGEGCSGTGTCQVTMTATRSVTASFELAIFDDVPFGYSQTLGGVTYDLYPYIQALWDNGFTNGIWIEKDGSGNITYALYGPTNNLNRGMVAKFLLNVVHGRDYTTPALPATPLFTLDDWSNPDIGWARPWAEELLAEALTNGCYIDPVTLARAFCPTNISTRAEAAKFGLTMKYGTSYTPPAASGDVFADMTLVDAHWGIAWAEKAYADGLLPTCGTDTGSGKPLYCPDDPINRAWSAYLIVKANNLLP